MYGLVHTAVRDMIICDFGEERWAKILQKSQVGEEAFTPMQNYDDAIILSLVSAASEELSLPAADCLRVFGKFWVLDTATKHYGEQMLSGYGDSMWDLLENLDHMHDRMASTFQGYDPPSFELEEAGDGSSLLHYRSSRQGLTPFVEGLIDGMAEHFDAKVRREVVSSEIENGGDHVVFRLSEISE